MLSLQNDTALTKGNGMGSFDKDCAAAVAGLIGLGVMASGGVDQAIVGVALLAVAVALALSPTRWFQRTK